MTIPVRPRVPIVVDKIEDGLPEGVHERDPVSAVPESFIVLPRHVQAGRVVTRFEGREVPDDQHELSRPQIARRVVMCGREDELDT